MPRVSSTAARTSEYGVGMSAAMTLVEIRAKVHAFVRDWDDAEGYEQGEAQEFIRDLLACYGIAGRRAATYEARAERSSTGGRGRIDVLIPGLAVIEMKSAGADLATAEQQALDYLDSLGDAELPRWVLCSDFKRFRLKDLTADGQPVVEFTLRDLSRQPDLLAFFAGFQRSTTGARVQEAISVKGAALMSEIFVELEKARYPTHASSVFLTRVLFCLYADDSGLWERDLFQEFIRTRTAEDGSDLGSALNGLFEVLDQPENRRYTQDELLLRFPYVNGSVFTERVDTPWLGPEARAKLLKACAFNWAELSPAIFGSLFQAVKDKESRRKLGEHYTTEKNILRQLEPLFLDELRAEFDAAHYDAARLHRLRDHLGELRIADMAAGCGNFLIIAYREMRRIELDALVRLRELQVTPDRVRGDLSDLGRRRRGRTNEFESSAYGDAQMAIGGETALRVKKAHFYGVEIEEWPATIAQTAMYFAEHQANQEMAERFGEPPSLLPLTDGHHIVVGDALEVDWRAILPLSEHTYIVGNPPFLGDKSRSEAQKKQLKHVWKGHTVGRMDYVTAWYKKAMDFFGTTPGRFAFVSTNSINKGDQTARLFGPLFESGWDITFSHAVFAWSSEVPGQAAVHCVILGFQRRDHFKGQRRIFHYESLTGDPIEQPADFINAYLFDGPDIRVASRRTPLSQVISGGARRGSMPSDGQHLLVTAEQYAEFAADSHAAKYLRPYLSADDLLDGVQRWCLWMEDVDPRDVRASSLLRERIRLTGEFRSRSTAATTRNYGQDHRFRQPQASEVPYLLAPRVSSERRRYLPVGHMAVETIASDASVQIADSDGLGFALISSAMFREWLALAGGSLKSDFRFGHTLVWWTFPVPTISNDLRIDLIEAGQSIQDARDLRPELTLAEHYDADVMAPTLVAAHEKVDRLVDKVFGSRGRITDPVERRDVLVQHYLAMVADERGDRLGV